MNTIPFHTPNGATHGTKPVNLHLASAGFTPPSRFDTPEIEFIAHRLTRQAADNLAMPRLDELHMWRFRPEWLPVAVKEGESWLSKSERERARRQPSSAQRKRFIATQLVLRWIVAKLFRCAPRAVQFQDNGDEPLCARHPHSGQTLIIDITYAGIWIVICIGQVSLGLGAALPRFRQEATEREVEAADRWQRGPVLYAAQQSTQLPDSIRQQARVSSLSNALRHRAIGIEPEILAHHASSGIADLAAAGCWQIFDIPMPGGICAAVSVAHPVAQIHAYGWPKI